MPTKISYLHFWFIFLTTLLIFIIPTKNLFAQEQNYTITPGNFGLPGIIDLPTGKRFPDGEIIITQQLHKSLARSGISFQALPRLGFSFRYSGHGIGGNEAYGRTNHDRSFDAHLTVWDEGIIRPAISLGLRDFIGTGWYSSEYIVGSKSLGNLEITAGLGFGRLAGRNKLSNPLGKIDKRFETREKNNTILGGTLGSINWFQGDASAFYGIAYRAGPKLSLVTEYSPDIMSREATYLKIKKPWNFGISYQFNDFVNVAAQYLHGSQASLTTSIIMNPGRPPVKGGQELAPVPFRKKHTTTSPFIRNDPKTIRKVLTADSFEIHDLTITKTTIRADVTNHKFRSTAQAVGRIASTLQRFTNDTVEYGEISFYRKGMQVASYRINLEEVAQKQFGAPPSEPSANYNIDLKPSIKISAKNGFTWGIGPYFSHRLFNPDLPLSVETGIELRAGYNLAPGLAFSGGLRKSVLTNFTDNQRRSDSQLPKVHSDWIEYDLAGQSGHIHDLTLSYLKNLAPGIYGRFHAGLLEPFYAGIGGELLYKPAKSSVAFGLDLHKVQQRDFDMRFDLRPYKTVVGHLSAYYDAGNLFNIELNVGRYLAGDWGATTTISRKFGSGWEVGGYATLTDVPFATFGEGSFDKAIFVSMPIDWILGTPNRTRRRLTIRPITRDGGANLASARSLYRYLENSQKAQFLREYGRLWK